ncbi:MAG: SRPBCC domain-containing protein [Acidobacteriota bacterium]|nr:SRPBCC domain-containing protein [Acidobacteriota bacterium]
MKSFSTSVHIRATPEAIWRTLMDTGRWPELDSSIVRVDGTPALGATVTVHAKVGRAFALTVTELTPHERMVLSGGMPLGLFRGTRTYAVSRHADDTMAFSMREVYTGLLAPLITRSIPDLQPSFDRFAANLKTHAERAA